MVVYWMVSLAVTCLSLLAGLVWCRSLRRALGLEGRLPLHAVLLLVVGPGCVLACLGYWATAGLVLPQFVDLHLFEVLVLGEKAILLATLAATLAALWRGSRVVWGLWVAVAFLAGLFEVPLTAPIAPGLTQAVVSQGVFLQTRTETSGPAALATLLRASGHGAGEREVAEAAGTTWFGTSLAMLARAAGALGCRDVRAGRFALSDLARHGGRSVLLVSRGGARDDHWVALLAVEKDRWVLGDPGQGRRVVSASELASVWRGRAVLLEPPGKKDSP